MRNVTSAPSGIKLFNRVSSVETRFLKSFSFQSKTLRSLESKTSDILKSKDVVFNIRRKLILKVMLGQHLHATSQFEML